MSYRLRGLVSEPRALGRGGRRECGGARLLACERRRTLKIIMMAVFFLSASRVSGVRKRREVVTRTREVVGMASSVIEEQWEGREKRWTASTLGRSAKGGATRKSPRAARTTTLGNWLATRAGAGAGAGAIGNWQTQPSYSATSTFTGTCIPALGCTT